MSYPQGPTQNPEQVGEQGVYGGVAALPKPTSVCGIPIDREGLSNTLHWNFLLSISHNLEQDEGENAVEGAGSNEPTSVPHEEDMLLADSLTKSQPESTPCSPPKQHELVKPEPTGLTSLDSTDDVSKLMMMCLLH